VGYDGLMRAMEHQGAEVGAGDFLMIHTGYDDALLAMRRNPDPEALARSGPALDGGDTRLLNWISDSDIVAICSDHPAVEMVDMSGEACAAGASFLPLHEHCLFKLGIHLGELWWLGDLARWLGEHRRSACFLTAPPLRLPGSVGSPVTPIATV
jgi:kynurenine formamidase